MSDTSAGNLTTGRIAEATGGQLIGPADIAITAMNTLDEAAAGELTYIGDERYKGGWAASAASAALVAKQIELDPGPGRAIIRVVDVDLATAAVLAAMAPPAVLPEPGVHSSAVVEPSAKLGEGVRIGAGCYVGRRVELAAGVVLHANVSVMDDATIGAGTTLWPGVVIRERCSIGARCVLHPNVTIGADGFGYRPAPGGKGLVKIPQIGTVQIGDDVEIGASTCVDRGKFGPTRIGDGTKIDNLCHIAHNCQLGRCVVMAGMTGLGGSVVVGDGVVMGAQVGIRDHVTIGPAAQVAAKSGVMNDIPPGETWAGYPAKDARMAMREHIAMTQVPEALKILRKMQRERDAGG